MNKLSKLAFFFCLSITCLYASDEAMEVHDLYLDKKPQTKHIFSINTSDFEGPQYDSIDGTTNKAWNDINNNLDKLCFRPFDVGHGTGGREEYSNYIFGKFNGQQQLKECLFIHLEYSMRSRSLHLLSVEPNIFEDHPHKRIMTSWSYVERVTDYCLWRGGAYKLLAKRLPVKIKEEGLQNTFIRLGVVINDDYTLSFYNIFETPEEEKKGLVMLHKIQTAFSQ